METKSDDTVKELSSSENAESADSVTEKLSDFLESRIKIQREIIPDLPPPMDTGSGIVY